VVVVVGTAVVVVLVDVLVLLELVVVVVGTKVVLVLVEVLVELEVVVVVRGGVVLVDVVVIPVPEARQLQSFTHPDVNLLTLLAIMLTVK
jgi:hypothetical protein